MHPVELTARRQALGLPRPDLAKLLEVREHTILHWEQGSTPPRSWDWIHEVLTALERFQRALTQKMVADTLELAPHRADLAITTYLSQEDYEAGDPDSREVPWPAGVRGVPVEIHQVAAARAAQAPRTDHQLGVALKAVPRLTLVTAPGTPRVPGGLS